MEVKEIIKFLKPENYLIILIFSMLITGVFAYLTAKLFSKDRSKRRDVDKKIKEVFKPKSRRSKKHKLG